MDLDEVGCYECGHPARYHYWGEQPKRCAGRILQGGSIRCDCQRFVWEPEQPQKRLV